VPSEEETLQSSTASDSAIADAVATVAASVYGIAQTIAATELEFATNPCARETVLFSDLLAADAKIDTLISGVEFWAARNQSAVDRAIDNWGFGATGAIGGIAFSAYLFNNNYTGLLVPRAAMPSGPGDRKPSSANEGDWIGAGVYLKNGRLQGSRLVDAWYHWIDRMRYSVYAPWIGRPAWRERLHSWVGTSQPGNWRKWVPGDPIAANSTVGRAIARRDQIQAAYDDAHSDCTQGRAASRAAGTALLDVLGAGAATGLPVLQLPPADDADGGGATDIPVPLLIGLGVAAAVLIRMRR